MQGAWHGVRTPTARFSAPTALFTDAVMSVKSVQPYCRLGLGALKTTFFTDAAWF